MDMQEIEDKITELDIDANNQAVSVNELKRQVGSYVSAVKWMSIIVGILCALLVYEISTVTDLHGMNHMLINEINKQKRLTGELLGKDVQLEMEMNKLRRRLGMPPIGGQGAEPDQAPKIRGGKAEPTLYWFQIGPNQENA